MKCNQKVPEMSHIKYIIYLLPLSVTPLPPGLNIAFLLLDERMLLYVSCQLATNLCKSLKSVLSEMFCI